MSRVSGMIDVTNININELGQNLTEQSYIELADQMKDIVEEKEKEVQKIRGNLKQVKRDLYKGYGLFCYIHEIVKKLEISDQINSDIDGLMQDWIEQVEESFIK